MTQFSKRVVLKEDEMVIALSNDGATFGQMADNKLKEGRMSGRLDKFVRLGIQLLGLPEIAEFAPHLALEGVEVVSISDSKAIDAQRDRIIEGKQSYLERFGVRDQLGQSNVLRVLTDEKEPIYWGDVTFFFGRRDDQPKPRSATDLTLIGPKLVSVQLVLDVFAGLISDSRLRADQPEYYVPYLRRWGEEAFAGVALKPGIPEVLDAGVQLQDDDEEQELGLFDLLSGGSAAGSSPSLDAPSQNVVEASSNELQGALAEIAQLKAQLAEQPTSTVAPATVDQLVGLPEYQDLKTALEASAERCRVLEEQLELQPDAEELELQLKQLRSELVRLKGRNNSLERKALELDSANRQVAILKARVERTQEVTESNSILQQQLEELQEQLRSKEREVAELEERIQTELQAATSAKLDQLSISRLQVEMTRSAGLRSMLTSVASCPADELAKHVRTILGRDERFPRHRQRVAHLLERSSS